MTLAAEESLDEAAHVVAERVLIVEDEPAARNGLEQLVKSWGFVAESASDGEEALQKVTSFRPAIVITDMVMPRMDGIALLRALHQQGADATTLLLTAQGTVETAVEAMKEGAYDYLTKPVDIERLKILLDKIVERLETMREVKSLRRQLREHGAFGRLTGDASEAAARPSGAEFSSSWRADRTIGRRSGHRGDQYRSCGGGEGRKTAGGPVLPPQRVFVPSTDAAGTQGRPAAPGPGIHQR